MNKFFPLPILPAVLIGCFLTLAYFTSAYAQQHDTPASAQRLDADVSTPLTLPAYATEYFYFSLPDAENTTPVITLSEHTGIHVQLHDSKESALKYSISSSHVITIQSSLSAKERYFLKITNQSYQDKKLKITLRYSKQTEKTADKQKTTEPKKTTKPKESPKPKKSTKASKSTKAKTNKSANSKKVTTTNKASKTKKSATTNKTSKQNKSATVNKASKQNKSATVNKASKQNKSATVNKTSKQNKSATVNKASKQSKSTNTNKTAKTTITPNPSKTITPQITAAPILGKAITPQITATPKPTTANPNSKSNYSLSTHFLRVEAGNSFAIAEALDIPENMTALSYQSAFSDNVSIQNGILYAKSSGIAVIEITGEDFKSSCTICIQ